jgi:hypothetical protein
MKELETNIGIVGTEAKSTKEKIVKHRRKIWSIPIAVLALVLMLAGALVVSGVVQAQTSARVPSSINMVAPTEPGTILVYEVKNYRVPAEGTTGPGPIYVTGTGVPDGTPTAETTRETPLVRAAYYRGSPGRFHG